MKNLRKILESQLEDYASRMNSLYSFITELNSTAGRLGTDREQFEQDLIEAEHNVEYYQSQIARIKKELAASDSTATALTSKPAMITKPGIIALALSPISFFAGALLGSRLKSRRDNPDKR